MRQRRTAGVDDDAGSADGDVHSGRRPVQDFAKDSRMALTSGPSKILTK
jgi:hypothetical protein